MTNRYENANTKGSWKVIGVIMAAIALWGIYHAVGAGLSVAQKNRYFGMSAWWQTPAAKNSPAAAPPPEQNTARDRSDFRRSLVVAAASFSFLAFWAAMLYLRQRRLQKKDLISKS